MYPSFRKMSLRILSPRERSEAGLSTHARMDGGIQAGSGSLGESSGHLSKKVRKSPLDRSSASLAAVLEHRVILSIVMVQLKAAAIRAMAFTSVVQSMHVEL